MRVSSREPADALRARPKQPMADGPIGLRPLGIGRERDGFVYVPSSYHPDRPTPLVVMLHGAGGRGERTMRSTQALAERKGLIVLAPDARQATWDVLYGGFGPDVAFIDAALEDVFAHHNVDPARLAIGGFSDGASYALSLGLSNGDLFGHILAYSPGFAAPGARRGTPGIYVSHGVRDEVLPIEACSRRLVPLLRQAGYHVTYREFDGPHTVPPEIAAEAVDWLLAEP